MACKKLGIYLYLRNLNFVKCKQQGLTVLTKGMKICKAFRKFRSAYRIF